MDSNRSCEYCEKRVGLATHRKPFQLPSKIQGAMYPASILSLELVALVVSVGRIRPARRLKSLFFTENQNNETYVRVRHHPNEPCRWHVCAGRVKRVEDFDLTVARTGPHGGGGRVADAPRDRMSEKTSRRNHDKTLLLSHCVAPNC